VLETTERAFVFIDGFDFELTTRADAMDKAAVILEKRIGSHPDLEITRFAAIPRWKNGGNTPTKGLLVQVNWSIFEALPPIDVFQDYGSSRKPLFIAPKAVESPHVIEMSAAPRRLVDHSFHPTGEPPRILLWGRGDYLDVFGRSHFVEWCYELRLERHASEPMRAHFVQFGEHNCTDETN
jgi:hypothetical protein